MRLAYICFDRVPAPKGAAVHIEAFARVLGAAFGEVDLVTVANGTEIQGPVERWPGVRHTELPARGVTLIDRVLCFRRFLRRWLAGRTFHTIQFRSIFEGLPLLKLEPRPRLIYEVNGLPSIELKYRYPDSQFDRELMAKIAAQERACLHAADCVVTPSAVTGGYLKSSKCVVIPNGVDTDLFRPGERERGGEFAMMYFGTLTSWQGVDLTVRALARVPGTLTIAGPGGRRQRDGLARLAGKLGVAGRLRVLPALSQSDVAAELQRSDAVLAPLELNDRNAIQGCCPLKVLEGMAAGVPVIASDLPVVRELGCDGVHFLLVKPGSVDQIAAAAVRLSEDRLMGAEMGRAARSHVEANFTWKLAGQRLAALIRG